MVCLIWSKKDLRIGSKLYSLSLSKIGELALNIGLGHLMVICIYMFVLLEINEILVYIYVEIMDDREVEREREAPTHFVYPNEGPLMFQETYDIIEAIGTLTCTGTPLYITYHAAPFCPTPNVLLPSALAYVKEDDKESITKLEDERRKNHSSSAIFMLGKHRSHAFHYEGYYCYTFYYPASQGSLLSFMARHFPRGLPEKCILFFVRPVVQALLDIHAQGPHGQISAANVLVDEDRSGKVNAFLAYGASLHILHSDRLRDSANPSYLPATSVCTWAAPPPYRHKHDEISDDEPEHHEIADDIWFVGILLLEMAYGGLRVRDRAELDSFLHKIRRKNKLPKKLNDACNNHSKSKRASSSSLPLPACFNPKKAAIAPVGFEYMPEERVFSKKFTNLVIRCLDPDPAKRPTARKLDRSKIFNNRKYDLPFFRI